MSKKRTGTLALCAATTVIAPGCARKVSVTELSHAGPYEDSLAGRRVRLTFLESGVTRAVTLRVDRYEWPFLTGDLQREEVEAGPGIWIDTHAPSERRRMDVTHARTIELIGGLTDAEQGIFWKGAIAAGLGALVCLGAVAAASGTGGGSGRAFRDRGSPLLPVVVSAPRGRRDVAHEPDVSCALKWLDSARKEAASVPAFLRMAEELRVAGAPEALARGAERAAREETVHARLCFEELGRMTSTELYVLPLPYQPRWNRGDPQALTTLALEAWGDGCVAEGAAAAEVEEAARAVDDARAAALFRRIAFEEAGHAELAWNVLAWTLHEGGLRVRRAVEDAARDRAGALFEASAAFEETRRNALDRLASL